MSRCFRFKPAAKSFRLMKKKKTFFEFTQGLRQEKYIYMRGVWVGCAHEKRWVCFWWARKESRQMACSVRALASISGHREKQQKGGEEKKKSWRAKQASAPVEKPNLLSCANNAPLPLHSKYSTQAVSYSGRHALYPLFKSDYSDATSQTRWARCSSLIFLPPWLARSLKRGQANISMWYQTLKLCSGKAIRPSGSEAKKKHTLWLGIGIREPNCQTTLYLKRQSDWWSSSEEGHK